MTQLRVKITEISKKDVWYQEKDQIIGNTATATNLFDWNDGWFAADVVFDKPVISKNGGIAKTLFEFKYELVKPCKKRQNPSKNVKSKRE